MSIALSTIVLFFLFVPGILFRKFYYSEEFSGEYFKATFFEVFISTILPSVVLHLIWFFLAIIIGQNVDFQVLSDIVSSNPLDESFSNVQNNSLKIFSYNISLFIFSGICGYYSKQIIRNKKWDRKFKIFRYQNSWHYILKGEFFDFPRAEITLETDDVEDIEFVFIDALIEIGGVSYLYDGILVDYELTSNGGLQTVSIKNAQRRKLSDDSDISNSGAKSDNSDKFYPIAGHILLIKYSEVKNLNFVYLKLVEQDDKLMPIMVS